MSGQGEQALRQAVRRLARARKPEWLHLDIAHVQEQLDQLRANLRALELQRAQYGLRVPLDLHNEIFACQAEIEMLEEKLAVLHAGWRALTTRAQRAQLRQDRDA
jgi:uncharacterized coiled-coil DUF342 family protein